MDWTMDRSVLGCMVPECTLSLHRSTPCAHTVLYVTVITPYLVPKALQISSCLASYSSPDINMYACSPLRQPVVTVLCTNVGINQGEQSGLCHSVSDAYKLQTGHRCSSYVH